MMTFFHFHHQQNHIFPLEPIEMFNILIIMSAFYWSELKMQIFLSRTLSLLSAVPKPLKQKKIYSINDGNTCYSKNLKNVNYDPQFGPKLSKKL